jgi:SAM-dependent methyltransferase
MLKAHLDPESDAASRKPETILKTVNWLVDQVPLLPGQSILDLGCGPGLYDFHLAAQGFKVTGVDFSPGSIEFARQTAAECGLKIEFRCQDYLTLDDVESYDAVLLIYGDYCVPPKNQRLQLLSAIRRALRKGGSFVFDVTTRTLRQRIGLKNSWYAVESGFWKPDPHLVLESGFDYPELSLYLDQYIVVEANGKVTTYRNWFQDFSPDSIRLELEEAGFMVMGMWGDLAGSEYTPESDWIGLITQPNQ